MLARFAAHFAKLWSAVATEPPLWEGGGRRRSRERRKHHALRGVTIPPPSQIGGLATALQSASHNVRALQPRRYAAAVPARRGRLRDARRRRRGFERLD